MTGFNFMLNSVAIISILYACIKIHGDQCEDMIIVILKKREHHL